MSLNVRAAIAVLSTVVVMGAIVFPFAGTFNYPQAWWSLLLWLISALALTGYLMKRDRALLERRMRGGPFAESLPSERVLMAIASLGFIAIFVVAGLDRRFGWSSVPTMLVAVGYLLFAIGWAIITFVFRENSFTSSTIEIAADQHVVSTGPYAIVRHPMYAGAFLYVVGMPLTLASWWAFAPVTVLIAAIIVRMFDEERLLMAKLPGYADYKKTVRYRLIPYLW